MKSRFFAPRTAQIQLQIHRGLDTLPEFKHAVLTIGSYDGVHHGHRAILKRLVEVARASGGESILLTFDPHPRKVVFPNDKSLRLLNTLDEKIRLLQATGIDHLIVAPFTVEFSQINPYDYVDKILVDKIQVKHLIIGYDHKFGLNREGNIDLLNIYAKQEAFVVEEIAKQEIDSLHVSSTKIRTHISEGQIEQANVLLGQEFPLSGFIEQGHQLAGKLGYPTANCIIPDTDKILPASGTYAAKATCRGVDYEGMLYIGDSKTLLKRNKTTVEIHLFANIKQPLYGEEIIIFPLKRIRSDQYFDSKAELIFNIEADKIACEQYFKNFKSDVKCSIAILNYNGSNWLKKFLPYHIKYKDDNSSIIVIDNASQDDSIGTTRSISSEIKIECLENNLGYAQGYNVGLESINSEYIAVVNTDLEVTEGWLEPLIKALDENPELVAVQPKILDYNRRHYFEYAGASGGFIDTLGYPLSRGRVMDHLEKDDGQYDDSMEVDWVTGAAMVVRRSEFEAAGGFDGDFFAHMEEIDLCWRWRKAGWHLKCIPESVVYHVGGGTLGYETPRKAFLNLRNNYWMIRKNMPLSRLLWVLPVRCIFDFGYGCLQFLKGKFSVGVSVFKGIFSGLSKWSEIRSKKKHLKYYARRSKGFLYARTTILNVLPISFYILNKKTFNQYKRR